MQSDPRLPTQRTDDTSTDPFVADTGTNWAVWVYTTMLDDTDDAGQPERNVVRGID